MGLVITEIYQKTLGSNIGNWSGVSPIKAGTPDLAHSGSMGALYFHFESHQTGVHQDRTTVSSAILQDCAKNLRNPISIARYVPKHRSPLIIKQGMTTIIPGISEQNIHEQNKPLTQNF